MLNDLKLLKSVVSRIRNNYQGFFSCKIRLGFHDTSNFEIICKELENLGVDLLSIHCRTRDQQYRDRADWTFLTQAKKWLSIPVIGNGDIWNPQDYFNMLDATGVDGVMLGRGALKTPWMAWLIKEFGQRLESLCQDPNFLLSYRQEFLPKYLGALYHQWSEQGVSEAVKLKLVKNLSHYLFDDLEEQKSGKKHLFRSQSIQAFIEQCRQTWSLELPLL